MGPLQTTMASDLCVVVLFFLMHNTHIVTQDGFTSVIYAIEINYSPMLTNKIIMLTSIDSLNICKLNFLFIARIKKRLLVILIPKENFGIRRTSIMKQTCAVHILLSFRRSLCEK